MNLDSSAQLLCKPRFFGVAPPPATPASGLIREEAFAWPYLNIPLSIPLPFWPAPDWDAGSLNWNPGRTSIPRATPRTPSSIFRPAAQESALYRQPARKPRSRLSPRARLSERGGRQI